MLFETPEALILAPSTTRAIASVAAIAMAVSSLLQQI
jgi:hypothetical protein